MQSLVQGRSTSRALTEGKGWGLGVDSFLNSSKEEKFLDSSGGKMQYQFSKLTLPRVD